MGLPGDKILDPQRDVAAESENLPV